MNIQYGMCIPDVCQDLDVAVSNNVLYQELDITISPGPNSITEATKHTQIENAPQFSKGIM